jgi:hypothetical protein
MEIKLTGYKIIRRGVTVSLLVDGKSVVEYTLRLKSGKPFGLFLEEVYFKDISLVDVYYPELVEKMSIFDISYARNDVTGEHNRRSLDVLFSSIFFVKVMIIKKEITIK